MGLFLRQQPWDDVSIDICEAEVATGVAVCQAFMVKAQFGGVTRIDKFFFYGGLKTKFLRQQARDYIAVNIREAEVATCVAVGLPLVVKAQKSLIEQHPENLLLLWNRN